jgi:hypothetical protein
MLPSGKHTKNYGKSPFFMGKSIISMAMASIANCQPLPEGSMQIAILPTRVWTLLMLVDTHRLLVSGKSVPSPKFIYWFKSKCHSQ